MRKTEQRLWDRMRARLQGKVRLERIENLVSEGIPDVLALVDGRVTPIELKAIEDFPVRISTPLLGTAKGLSVEQRNWHMEWRRWGGTSLVLVGVGSKVLYVIEGRHADLINEFSREAFEQHALARSWDELAHLLRNL